eukprot:2754869-Rhodomonas_salina.1
MVTFRCAKGPEATKQGDIAWAEKAARAEAKRQLHQILLTKAREHDEKDVHDSPGAEGTSGDVRVASKGP